MRSSSTDLAPFAYYGIHDGLDLRRCRGDADRATTSSALTDVYTANDAWARLCHHAARCARRRSVARCAASASASASITRGSWRSVFTGSASSAVARLGRDPDPERQAALRDLAGGRVSVMFSVDLFNEGVDIPARRHNADAPANREPDALPAATRPRAAQGARTRATAPFSISSARTAASSASTCATGRCSAATVRHRARGEGRLPLPSRGVPHGARPRRRDVVLRSIRDAIPTRWPAKVEELRALRTARGRDVTLREYLGETGLEIEDVYAGNRTWSELREAAGLEVAPAGPHEVALRRGVARLRHIDDRQRTATYRRWLSSDRPPNLANMSDVEARLARMLAASIADTAIPRDLRLQAALDLVWAHPQPMRELTELLDIDSMPRHLQRSAFAEVPLQIHARYTRIEILAAVGEGEYARTPQWREGVYDAKAGGADLLAFTLDKTNGDFSPTTRYRDYAVSRDLIHWESQSTARADSATGRRYQNHDRDGQVDPALRSHTAGRPSLLVSRTRQVHASRRRTPDGHHLETPNAAFGRPLRGLRRRGCLSRITPIRCSSSAPDMGGNCGDMCGVQAPLERLADGGHFGKIVITK